MPNKPGHWWNSLIWRRDAVSDSQIGNASISEDQNAIDIHESPESLSIIEISTDSEEQRFVLTPQLEQILKHPSIVNKEVVLFSISGAFRKGKSFILNIFLAYLEWRTNGEKGEWLHKNIPMDKFKYRSGSDPHTNGFTMWSKPYLLEGPDGKEYAIFLMDTQGTFDQNSSVSVCTSIFALSTLLSSVQIYNLSHQIQGDDLNNLQLFVQYAKLAANKSGTVLESSIFPFQKLIFLIRDWPNPHEDPYGLQGGQNYLQRTLENSNNLPKEKQEERKSLHYCFEKITAVLMPHPGKAVAIGNSKIVLGELEKDFEDALKTFIPGLFSPENLLVKKICGRTMTCGNLADLCKRYMDIFNSGTLIKPKTIFDANAEMAARAAEEAGRFEYDNFMKENMDENLDLCDVNIFNQHHESAKLVALKKFDECQKMEGYDCEEHKTTLKKHIKEQYEIRLQSVKKAAELAKWKEMSLLKWLFYQIKESFLAISCFVTLCFALVCFIVLCVYPMSLIHPLYFLGGFATICLISLIIWSCCKCCNRENCQSNVKKNQ